MRKAKLLLIMTVLLLSPFVVAAQRAGSGESTPPIPETFYASHSGNPVWVSADLFVDQAGEPDTELINSLPNWYDSVNDILTRAKKADAPCLELGTISVTPLPPPPGQPESYYRPARSLEEFATRKAQAVLKGTVVGSKGGFYSGWPGLLLQIRIDERLKSSDNFWSGPYVYVYYPVGEFYLGSIRICKTDYRWPAPPEAGDGILLFPTIPAPDQDGVVMATQMSTSQEVVFDRDGRLLGGVSSWIDDAERLGQHSLDALAQRLRLELETENEEGAR